MLKVPDHSDAASTGHSTSCRAAQPCWPHRAPASSSSHHSAYRTLPSAPHLYGESPCVSAELTILPAQHLNNVFFLLGWVMFWFGSLQLFLFFFPATAARTCSGRKQKSSYGRGGSPVGHRPCSPKSLCHGPGIWKQLWFCQHRQLWPTVTCVTKGKK